jgi:hypothetical protein
MAPDTVCLQLTLDKSIIQNGAGGKITIPVLSS